MQSVKASSLVLPTSPSPSQPFTLVGRSRAGDGTTFVIPELRWMFDCGALVEGGGLRHPNIVWLTHTHSDHVLTLAQFCHSREAQASTKPLPVYLPAQALPFVRDYLHAYGAMITMGQDDDNEDDDNNNKTQKKKKPLHNNNYELIGVTPNQEISIREGGKTFVVTVVECVHRIDCVGYSIVQQQHKLKEEYKGLPGKEIGALKKQGVEVTSVEQSPLLCYLGDTTAQVFTKHPEILQQHTVIVVECSFIDDDSLDNAKRTKHMHWSELKPIIQANPNTLFMLTHFSLKYSVHFLRQFFNEELCCLTTTTTTTTTHNNIHPMLVKAELEQEWRAKQQKKDETDSNFLGDPPPCNCFVCTRDVDAV